MRMKEVKTTDIFLKDNHGCMKAYKLNIRGRLKVRYYVHKAKKDCPSDKEVMVCVNIREIFR